MPSKRTILGAAAFSAALAGGGIAGAVLGTPSLSGAQDTTSTTHPRARQAVLAGALVSTLGLTVACGVVQSSIDSGASGATTTTSGSGSGSGSSSSGTTSSWSGGGGVSSAGSTGSSHATSSGS